MFICIIIGQRACFERHFSPLEQDNIILLSCDKDWVNFVILPTAPWCLCLTFPSLKA